MTRLSEGTRTTRQFLIHSGWIVVFLASATSSGQQQGSSASLRDQSASYYVWNGAASGGDGSEIHPFKSLSSVEAASGPGDVIYVSTTGTVDPLDGGIALKPGQKLIGLGPDGQPATARSSLARLTNSTDHLDGVIVTLSERNEVAGIQFADMRNHAILSSDSDLSGTHIHHNAFSGAVSSQEIIWSVRLMSESGVVSDVIVADNVFRDGDALGGIQVVHSGASSGKYLFERNEFSDLGGRAFHIWSQDTSRIDVAILDSVADNIGVGDRNSDSILPHLSGKSVQNVVVRNYRYKNTKQVGSRSNTGLEAFFMGAPFPGEESWCVGCTLTLKILDSVFENPITDGIQLTNFGSNTVFDVEIRNTKIIGANPQQAGGAISLIAQNAENSGSQTKLLMEDCDIIDSSRYGFVVTDQGDGYTSIVDLGGGALGSKGNNRFINSAVGEVQAINANPIAKHNWWGGKEARVDLQGDKSTIDFDQALTADPRSR